MCLALKFTCLEAIHVMFIADISLVESAALLILYSLIILSFLTIFHFQHPYHTNSLIHFKEIFLSNSSLCFENNCSIPVSISFIWLFLCFDSVLMHQMRRSTLLHELRFVAK